jgi:gamma-glutamyl-gamma-aminobutyrate hydrolase PuuD
VEAPVRPFVIGVQWHAECLHARAEHGALFAGLAQSAHAYARVRRAEEAA